MQKREYASVEKGLEHWNVSRLWSETQGFEVKACQMLTTMGQSGWELFAEDEIQFIFKRKNQS